MPYRGLDRNGPLSKSAAEGWAWHPLAGAAARAVTLYPAQAITHCPQAMGSL